MPSGTRGLLREQLVAIHTNCDWIKKHCEKCMGLLTDDYPELQASFLGLAQVTQELDGFAQKLHGSI